jgi:hypothetical protein
MVAPLHLTKQTRCREDVLWSGGIDPHILHLEANGQLHAPAALCPVPIQQETGWDRARVWTPLWALDIRPVGRPARSQPLYRLRYRGARSYGRGVALM